MQLSSFLAMAGTFIWYQSNPHSNPTKHITEKWIQGGYHFDSRLAQLND